ncbi:MAG TPA: hypothetical protein ENI51_08830, partial [Candidatus Atribacteria bacterium]|nr:hypothetical protein [Candidatus Atribacteria bacterium]
MRIAFITFGHVDVTLSLLKYISKEIDVDIYFMFAKNKKKESIINFENIDVETGFLNRKKINEILGIKIQEYINNNFGYYVFIYKNLNSKNFNNILLSYKLGNFLKKKKYDCIHFNGNDLQQLWISVFTPKIPKVHTIHDYTGHTGESNKWAEKFNKFLMFSKNQKIIHHHLIGKNRKGTLNIIYYGPLEIYKLWCKKRILEKDNTLLF